MKKCSQCHQICVEKIPLFKTLPQALQHQIAKLSDHKELERGEYLFREGETSPAIHIIRYGKVKLNRYHEDGKEFIYDILVAGDTIGEERFITSEKMDYNAICIEQTGICVIRQERIRALIDAEPQLAWNIIVELNHKVQMLSEKLELMSESDALTRLAIFLRQRQERLQQPTIELNIDDISSSINLRRETVSRKLQELQKLGIIKRSGHRRIEVIDEEKLKTLSL